MTSTNQPRRANKVAPKEPPPKEDRDPHHINDHIKIDFYGVLGEPSTAPQTVDFVWECSEIFFDCFREIVYKFSSLCCGVCIAIYWGLQFVPSLFAAIWFITPFTQCFKIACGGWCKRCCYLWARACIRPCTSACGLIFIHCGDGSYRNRPETPLYEPRKPRPKPQSKPVEPPKSPEIKKVAAVAFTSEFNDYDKEKIARSIKRQLFL
ncbi:CAV2-like protein [Mya arenaria]|uniref:Caveolin n=1 Tax=Mya arenaria TaxID=6604 RepID=A0ABY7GFN9_MYAAR|nr:caveolin-1-like [Mya arenaria]WAR31741.1 CAV2-like protein [Mya arenaria]